MEDRTEKETKVGPPALSHEARDSIRLKFFEVTPTGLDSQFQALDNQNDKADVQTPFPKNKNHLIWLIVAKRRLGKSTLLLNVLTNIYQKHFTDVYFLSPSARNDDKFKSVIEGLEERGTFYSDCTRETLEFVMQDMMNNIEQWKEDMESWEFMKIDPYRMYKLPEKPIEPKHLIILDDCVDKFGAHNDPGHPLVRLCNNSYFHKTSIWVVTQRYNYLLPAMRQNLDMLTLFKIQNTKEMDDIISEVQCNKEIFIKAFTQSTMDDYSFLHIHWCDRGVSTCFKKYDRLEIPREQLIINERVVPLLDQATVTLAPQPQKQSKKTKKPGPKKLKLKDATEEDLLEKEDAQNCNLREILDRNDLRPYHTR